MRRSARVRASWLSDGRSAAAPSVSRATRAACRRFHTVFYMPDLNGGQVAAELRRRRPTVPIIFLSAYFSLPSDALEMADAFITKGEPPEVLIEKIEQLM